MPVYKHTYSAYSGETTPSWTRVPVLARYALSEAWSSKITVGLFILCWIPCLVSLIGIYLANNPMAVALVSQGAKDSMAIDASLFLKILEGQCWLALVHAASRQVS